MSPELSRRTFLKIFSTAGAGLSLGPASALSELAAPAASTVGASLLKSTVPLLGQLGKLQATGSAARDLFYTLSNASGPLFSTAAISLKAAHILGAVVTRQRIAFAEGPDVSKLASALLPSHNDALKPERIGESHFVYLPRIGPMNPKLDLPAYDDVKLREYLDRNDHRDVVRSVEREAWNLLIANGLELREAIRRSPEVRNFANEMTNGSDRLEFYWRSTDAILHTLRNSIGTGNYFVARMRDLSADKSRWKLPTADAWQYVRVFTDPERAIPELVNNQVFQWRSRFMEHYTTVFDDIGRLRKAGEQIDLITADSLREARARLTDLRVEIPDSWSRAIDLHCPHPIRTSVPEERKAPERICPPYDELASTFMPLHARRVSESVEIVRRLKDEYAVRAKLTLNRDRWTLAVRPERRHTDQH